MTLAFLWTASTGWIAVFVLAGAISLPYALRRLKVVGPERASALRWHYLLGFGVPAIALVHASMPGGMRMLDPAGLWLATAALTALFLQSVLGMRFREARSQIWLRRSHFAVMAVSVVLVGAHVVLDRA